MIVADKYRMNTDNRIEEQVEEYRKAAILFLNWGKLDNQIGFAKSTKIYENNYGGPTSFAVDSNENIYILDNINKKIKVFDNKGKLLNSFDIENADGLSSINLNDKEKIWQHNPTLRKYTVYSLNGKVFKSINYDTTINIPEFFSVNEERIFLQSSYLNEIPTNQFGSTGEPVYNAKIEMKTDIGWRYGLKTGNHYKVLNNRWDKNHGLLKPLLVYNNGNRGEIELQVDFLYKVYYEKEDLNNNIYFICYYSNAPGGKNKPVKIIKYNNKFKPVYQVNDIQYNDEKGFITVNRSFITKEGIVYIMDLDIKGITISKAIK